MTDFIDVAIVMGSDSDFFYIEPCLKKLKDFDISYEVRVLSAHRTPDKLVEYIKHLDSRDTKVVIAAAGMSAALSGVVAATTLLPVIGVPIPSTLDGMDAILSTLQMPPGVPVATMALGKAGATNAAILAARIIALSDNMVKGRVETHKYEMKETVGEKDRNLQDKLKELGYKNEI